MAQRCEDQLQEGHSQQELRKRKRLQPFIANVSMQKHPNGNLSPISSQTIFNNPCLQSVFTGCQGNAPSSSSSLIAQSSERRDLNRFAMQASGGHQVNRNATYQTMGQWVKQQLHLPTNVLAIIIASFENTCNKAITMIISGMAQRTYKTAGNTHAVVTLLQQTACAKQLEMHSVVVRIHCACNTKRIT